MSKFKVTTKNIVRKAVEEKYEAGGKEKFPYKQIGELKIIENEEDGSRFYKIKLNTSGEEYDVFDKNNKDKKSESVNPTANEDQPAPVEKAIEYPTDDISPEDIPF